MPRNIIQYNIENNKIHVRLPEGVLTPSKLTAYVNIQITIYYEKLKKATQTNNKQNTLPRYIAVQMSDTQIKV